MKIGEIVATSVAVAVGVILAALISKKLMKSSWEENYDVDEI